MSRLWDRGSSLDALIARFTVGRDRELDLELAAHDALASAAHAVMLCEIGVLTEDELAGLKRELAGLAADARAGRFEIAGDEEDCHTALENRLTERLGDAGRRIHTGRSRNDQVIAALRLWGREALVAAAEGLLALVDLLLELAEAERETALPGTTHTRQAMPSTAGFLFAAYAEGLLDDLPWLATAYRHLDRSPLGSASGFGVALPLDRQRVAELLGFASVQESTLAVQSDRGKSEWLALGAAAAVATDLGRLAEELIAGSREELGFFGLAEEVTTGSSIMPNKRNPDVLELIRAGAARARARQNEVGAIFAPLSAGYHRDLQLTKEPFLRGLTELVELLAASHRVLAGLTVDRQRCSDAMVRSIGATDEVYRRVATGEPFRTAYQEVATDPEGAVEGDPADGWRHRTHHGAPGALDLAASRQRVEEGREWVEERRVAHVGAWGLLGSG